MLEESQGFHACVTDLQGLMENCNELVAQRQNAQQFLQIYGPWFRRFDGDHRFVEVLQLCYMLLFSLAIGLLQPKPEVQAVVAAVLAVALLAYIIVANPYNEHMRRAFETLSAICLAGGFSTVCLHTLFEFDFDGNVDTIATCLNLGSLAFKILYHLVHVIPFYKRLLVRKCRSHRIIVDAEQDTLNTGRGEDTFLLRSLSALPQSPLLVS